MNLETITTWLAAHPVAEDLAVLFGLLLLCLLAYLRHHPRVNPDMTFLIRQLQPNSEGLPI